jgi:hypothetical protein
MLVARARAEARARDLRLAGLRQRHDRLAAGAEAAHDAGEPRFELGRGGVVGKREHGVRRVEAVEVAREHVEAGLDQLLRGVQRELGLVRVHEAVGHDLVAAGLELVPEREVPLRPARVPRLVRLAEVAAGDDVDRGGEPEPLEDLRRRVRRALEAVVEAQRQDVHARLDSRLAT